MSEYGRPVQATLSKLRLVIYSLLSSCSVVIFSLALQWFVYKDWLHDPGPVRIIGTVLACLTTFVLVWQWQEGIRLRELETQRRLEVIRQMNDRIRNALQAIECVTYAKDREATLAVSNAVDVIDAALRGATLEISKADSHPVAERTSASGAA